MDIAPRSFAGFRKAGHLGTLLTSLVYFDFCFAIWVLNAALTPFIGTELHLSSSEKGLLISVPVLAGGLLRVPLGIVAQYIGRKRTAQLQMALVIAGLVLCWRTVDTYEGLLGIGAILGVAGASFGVAVSLGSGWYPPEYKGLASGIAAAGNSGALFAVLFAPPLAEAFGWRAVYGLAAIPMVVAMVLLQIFAREPPDREHKTLRDYLRVLVSGDIWVFNLVYAVTFGGYVGLTSFLPTLFHDYYHLGRDLGVYTAGAIVAASALRVAGGWAADRIGGVRILPVLMALIVVACLAAATLPASPVVMSLILVLCFAAMGAGNGAVFQLVPLRYQSSTAVAGGLVGEIGALGGGLVPYAMGRSNEWAGSYSPGFIGLAVVAVAGGLILLRVGPAWIASWMTPKPALAREPVPAPPSAKAA